MNTPNTFTFFASAEGLTLLEDLARQGLDAAGIAQRIGVAEKTLANWRYRCPAIEAAVLHGRDWATAAVEGALLKRALGYTVEETSTEETSAGIKTKVSEKHVPGDLSAQLTWLKVHRPGVWGEKAAAPRNGMIEDILEAVKAVE